MKKIRNMLALLIAVVLLSSVFFITEAEQTDAPWQADLLKLMDPADVPSTTRIDYENTFEDGVEVKQHDLACEISVNGVAYGCEFIFEYAGVEITDWTPVQDWLGHIVTTSANEAGSDSASLAKAIDKRMAEERRSAQPGAEGLPTWAHPNLKVKMVRVSTPFYPELSVGKNGEATKRLQARLIELGFLSGKADGFYGEQTRAAVEAAETYVRELEQDLIDARPVETPAPVTVEPIYTVSAAPVAELPATTHTLTLIPRETPVPTPEPTPVPTPEPMDVAVDAVKLEPVTPVDGVADALLQAYLYSDSFIPARRELKTDDEGSDVTRLQTRLLGMGYTSFPADGHYGANTARAVRVFQYYNGLPQTGEADMQTLTLLYSADAKAPAYAMLSEGSSGEEVRTLQTRLRELGFTNMGADGSYGAGTVTAVQNLQQYLRDMEEAYIRSTDGTIAADADLSGRLTTEVNGAADPMLLEAFYSDSFPAVPGEMSSGSTGGDVVRLQRRLTGLEFYFGPLDGHYGGQTVSAVKDFQKRHKLPQTGIADTATLAVLFSGDAQKALKPYMLKVSIADQRVYAYGLDDNNEYTVLVRTMKCSTGKDATPTPKGTFISTTGPGARWHYFKKFTCWAQYAYYIEGDIMFHSVLYNEKDGPVTRSSVNNLGRKASHGCVRLSVEDAKWIWQNCPAKTKIVVY